MSAGDLLELLGELAPVWWPLVLALLILLAAIDYITRTRKEPDA